MAKWSQMPEDLLRLIARRLDTQFDVLRLRSVCSSWRSSVAPSPNPFRRGNIPIISHGGDPDDGTGVYLLPKRTIILLGVPRSCDQTVPSGWLLKVREDDPGGMNLLNPLSSCGFAPLPEDFPRVLDLMNLRVLELGHECVLQDSGYLRHDDDNEEWDTVRVAFLCLDHENDFALLRMIAGGTMVMFKSREKRWSRVQDMPSGYDDVILFKGEFYAVDNDGSTVVVGLDSSVTLIVQSTSRGCSKRLVESVGELLLVCMCWEETPRFKVYKLDREEKVWNEVKDLGDRVLFLGDEGAFSASAADLGACKGNCIFFMDHGGVVIGASSLKIGVYDMDSGIIGPVEDYAGYSRLFWPPPDWIVSRTLEFIGPTNPYRSTLEISSVLSHILMLHSIIMFQKHVEVTSLRALVLYLPEWKPWTIVTAGRKCWHSTLDSSCFIIVGFIPGSKSLGSTDSVMRRLVFLDIGVLLQSNRLFTALYMNNTVRKGLERLIQLTVWTPRHRRKARS